MIFLLRKRLEVDWELRQSGWGLLHLLGVLPFGGDRNNGTTISISTPGLHVGFGARWPLALSGETISRANSCSAPSNSGGLATWRAGGTEHDGQGRVIDWVAGGWCLPKGGKEGCLGRGSVCVLSLLVPLGKG